MHKKAPALSSPFFHHALSTNRVMLWVIGAMVPGILAQIYFYGYGVIINLVLASTFAIACEALILKLRNRPLREHIFDNSALLTGIILGVALPPLMPFWMLLIGVGFAIIFAKQLYGGLGYNPFNPAMVGYVLLLISFPVEMTAWLPATTLSSHHPSLIEALQLVFTGQTANGATLSQFREIHDGYTMATPLDHFKTSRGLGLMVSEVMRENNYTNNLMPALAINLAYLAGGIVLLLRGIIRWHIPVAFIAGLLSTSTVIYWVDNELYVAPWLHLVMGATMLGAFFIATDPVSAATTPKGRLLYGALIGVALVVIRSFGGYPDAIAFSVLLLNMAVPTLDHYTKPKVYGAKE